MYNIKTKHFKNHNILLVNEYLKHIGIKLKKNNIFFLFLHLLGHKRTKTTENLQWILNVFWVVHLVLSRYIILGKQGNEEFFLVLSISLNLPYQILITFVKVTLKKVRFTKCLLCIYLFLKVKEIVLFLKIWQFIKCFTVFVFVQLISNICI